MAKLENKTKENPKLEQNKLSDGRISLYLEYYLGREEKPVRYQASQAKREPQPVSDREATYPCGTPAEQGNTKNTCRT